MTGHDRFASGRGTGRAGGLAAAVLLSLLVSAVSLQALAQPASPLPPAPVSPSPPLRSSPMIQTPLPEQSLLEEHADTFFSAVRDGVRWVVGGLGDLVTPPTALDVARRSRQADPYDFVAMMEVAGYKLKEVESSVALIPAVGFTFGIARELSDADREWLAIQLDRHQRRRSGLFAWAERAIVQALLDAQELGGYQVEKVEVGVFPWPSVKFFIAPTEKPMGDEAGRLMRAIDQVNRAVKAGQAAPARPADGSTPAAAPRTPVQRSSP